MSGECCCGFKRFFKTFFFQFRAFFGSFGYFTEFFGVFFQNVLIFPNLKPNLGGGPFFSRHLYFSKFHGVFFWILESFFWIFHPKLDKMTFAIILTILIIITDSQSQDYCYLRSQSGSWTDLTSWFTRWPSTERTELPASKSSRGLHKKEKKTSVGKYSSSSFLQRQKRRRCILECLIFIFPISFLSDAPHSSL